MSTFEKFTQKKFKSETKSLATITKNKSISFNTAAMKNIVMGAQYAILYYDKENSLVGIKFTNKNTPEAYKIRKYRDGRLGNISVIAFLRYYEIEHSKTLAYTMVWNDEEKMAVINLKEHEENEGPLFPGEDDDQVPF